MIVGVFHNVLPISLSSGMMWRNAMRSYVLLFAIILLLPACAHKFNQAKVDTSIVKGKTTKEDVQSAFGKPDKIIKTGGMKIVSGYKEFVLHKPREVWIYSPHQIKLVDLFESELLKISFDDNGVVVNYQY